MSNRRPILFLILVLLVGVLLAAWVGWIPRNNGGTRSGRANQDPTIDGGGTATPRLPPQHTHYYDQKNRTLQGASVSIDTLILNFQSAKERYMERLATNYGDINIFLDENSTIARRGFLQGTSNAELAWGRIKRKMMIRILEHVISGNMANYVWATAGDSGAAGHGNFFDQQYTVVLQQQAADLFQSVGLNFIARPYAMHSSTSAPELGACVREIYGDDVDIMTWDFALTDGKWHWRLEFFAHRVMLLPRHPGLLVLRPGSDPVRTETVEHLVTEGMAALRFDEHYANTMKRKIPDTHYHPNLESLPELVRYFRCGQTLEMGSGGCAEHKFTRNGTCDDRDGRTNWHHGWKWHAYYGNIYTLFLMDLLDDSLQEIKQKLLDSPTMLWKRLRMEEESEFKAFEASDNFKYAHRWDIEGTALTTELFYHHSVYCHTARLPAETRYNGKVFNLNRNDDWFNFKKGFSAKRLTTNPEKEMRLAYAAREKHDCPLTLHIDSRDFFFATPRFGDFQVITAPNIEEFKYYGPHAPKGLILMCPAACTHDSCPGHKAVGASHVNEGKEIEIQVNGERVARAAQLDDCFLLERESGDFQWEPHDGGRFDIGVKMLDSRRHLRLSSVIVW